VADGIKPTRRVRAVPGGPHTDIFGHEDEDDALSTAPPKAHKPQVGVVMLSYDFDLLQLQVSAATIPPASVAPEEEEESGIDFGPRFKPSRLAFASI
jgi:hypothetical protein